MYYVSFSRRSWIFTPYIFTHWNETVFDLFVESPVSDDEEIFGDFEDLETGEVHKAAANETSQGEGEESDGDETDGKDPEGEETSRIEKKRKQKAAFDAMYPF